MLLVATLLMYVNRLSYLNARDERSALSAEKLGGVSQSGFKYAVYEPLVSIPYSPHRWFLESLPEKVSKYGRKVSTDVTERS